MHYAHLKHTEDRKKEMKNIHRSSHLFFSTPLPGACPSASSLLAKVSLGLQADGVLQVAQGDVGKNDGCGHSYAGPEHSTSPPHWACGKLALPPPLEDWWGHVTCSGQRNVGRSDVNHFQVQAARARARGRGR